MRIFVSIAAALWASTAIAGGSPAPLPAPAPAPIAERQLEDEIIYFVLPDRFENGDPANDTGGLKGDRLKTGYDPTA